MARSKIRTSQILSLNGASQDEKKGKILHIIQIDEERRNARKQSIQDEKTNKANFTSSLKLFQPQFKLIDLTSERAGLTLGTRQHQVGKVVVTYGLPHAEHHCLLSVSSGFKMDKEAFEHLMDIARVSVLGFDARQKSKKVSIVSVENDHLNPQFFSHFLPRPILDGYV